MKNNQLLRSGETIIRVLDIKDGQAFIVDCNRQTVPKWVNANSIKNYIFCSGDVLAPLPDINDLDPQSRKFAYEHFTYIAGVLPFVTDKKRRCEAITQITEERRISKQTVCNYLWLYLVYQNIAALSPKTATIEKSLTEDEKNIRWALNKFFYTQNKYSLNTAYTLMLKEKYCDAEGVLLPQYPSFYQFRYFYRNHKKMQNYYISRNGIKNYQRNYRPLLGDGIQEFAPAVGVGMLDATVCDIYLVNEAGGLVGRPILTACVDAYSGLCCGYSLSWEGGVYSLRNLMANVIADKVKLCKKHGISIKPEEWSCAMLPATLVTDMGKEYVSNTFEQIADLGVTIVNLPPYRPELKGAVEKFFDVVQGLYKPHLKGKGVIEPDYQERGTHDYRLDASLTIGTIIIGIIASFIVGSSAEEASITIGGIIGSIISGMLFVGFSEIINLLQQNADNQEKIIRKLEEKTAPLIKDTATNKNELQQNAVSKFINSTPKHLFRCEKCGKMIEKFPCIYCGNNPEN